MAKRYKQHRLALLGIGASALVALLVVILVVAVSLAGGSQQEETSLPSDQLQVEDLYEGTRSIPKFDYPQNQYDSQLFVEQDGFLRYDDGKAVIGVDVSEHQGDIDWQAVADAGVEFVMLRVGYRGMTQGLLNADATFAQNYEEARAAGLQVGAYFFSQAITDAEAQAEADFAVETLDGRELDYPLVFDWEPPLPSEELPAEDLRAYAMTGEEITGFAKAFSQRVEELGYIPCVYTNKHMAYNTFNLTELNEYDLWYAEYQPVPSLYYHFRMWQYTASGTVPGISGDVDINICFDPY